MDTNQRENDRPMPIERDAQINLVLNSPAARGVIDMGRVIKNFKQKRRLYAWVTLLCVVAGLCAALVWHQRSGSPVSVSTVVTLCYEIPNPLLDPLKNPDYTSALAEDDSIPPYVEVPDLTAPDGSELDLGKITSPFVLKQAMDGVKLSRSVSLSSLANSIRIEKILSQESKRMQEIASGMIAEKASTTYTQIQNVHLTYENRFVVTLTDSFSGGKLSDSELRLLLDRILDAYNAYLADTYADHALPVDGFSVIDPRVMDLPESLDSLRTAIADLCDYCNNRPERFLTYRSAKTGASIKDLLARLEQTRDNDVDYLYATVLNNSVANDPAAARMSFQYQLRSAQARLDQVNADIENTQRVLNSYKNDEIYITMQNSGDTKSTTATTAYYNTLVLQQADNYREAAALGITITNLEDRIARLDETGGTADAAACTEALATTLESCRSCYDRICDLVVEIQGSPLFTTYLDHSSAAGSSKGLLTGAAKKLMIGGFGGLLIGLGLWLLAAIAPEYRAGKKQETDTEAASKEVAEQ